MIELFGSSILNTVATAGINSFTSILRTGTSRAYGGSRSAREYTSTRGILINKRYLQGVPDFNKGYYFQFNPQTIEDVKQTIWETRSYAGLAYNDYIWANGGERIISFQLFLDGTPGSKYNKFRPTAYGSQLAKVPESVDKEGFGKAKNYFTKPLVDEVVSESRSVVSLTKNTFVPGKGPTEITYASAADGVSDTRVNERGILPEVELIQSFLYPEVPVGEKTPMFAQGGIVSPIQFRPPATAVFSFGPIYLEGIIKSAPIQYTLFDKDLVPLRGTIDIEFAVHEYEELSPIKPQVK